MLSRTLAREAHALARDPRFLASHIHNVLYLTEGGEGAADLLVAQARRALQGRAWLRLTNRPEVGVAKRALLRTLDCEASVKAIAWSPDGALLSSAAANGAVRTWEARTGALTSTIRDPGGEAELPRYVTPALAWSPDGRLLASGGGDGVVRVRERDGGSPEATCRAPGGRLNALAWSPDGRFLAFAGMDARVWLWEPATGDDATLLGEHPHWPGGVDGLAWSPDGRILLSADTKPRTFFWDMRERERIAELESAAAPLAWAPDALTLAMYSGGVMLLSRVAGERPQVLGDPLPRAFALAWSPDGTRLAAAGGEAWVEVGRSALHGTGLSPQGTDYSVRLWDPEAATLVGVLRGHVKPVRALAWSPDGSALASGSEDGRVLLWDWQQAQPPSASQPHPESVESVAWSPDGEMLASGSRDGPVVLWAGATGRFMGALDDHGEWVDALAWSPDGSTLASASRDKAVREGEVRSGAAATVVDTWDAVVMALAWSPDGRVLAQGMYDGYIGLRGLGKVLIGNGETVHALAWSPEGDRLASAVEDGVVRVWDPEIASELFPLEGHDGWVMAVAWSRDGARLASGGVDGTIRLWDAREGRPVGAPLEGHTGWLSTLIWLPSDQLLASGSLDGTVRLWRTDELECVAVAHCLSPVAALSCSEDGGVVRVADNGAASGNQPVPYLFELCGTDAGSLDLA